MERWHKAQLKGTPFNVEEEIEPPEVFISVVVPAYNETERITSMLEEAVDFLQSEYGSSKTSVIRPEAEKETVLRNRANGNAKTSSTTSSTVPPAGWEILVVDDGSRDTTVDIVLDFSRNHLLPARPRRQSGPWTHRAEYAVSIPPGSIRVVSLVHNRGKGGAVVHGLKHARGQYVVFADADGASRFPDVAKLVSACEKIKDDQGRAMAVGSRAHLVGSDEVIKRSWLRNFLMRSFHLILKWMTPPKTAHIQDTQCGFKLFSRQALPYIVPYMHSESWIFDVELLMLAEMANIPVAEVAIGWREVLGSKLNVIWASMGMAWGLAVLRLFWSTGVYRVGVQAETTQLPPIQGRRLAKPFRARGE